MVERYYLSEEQKVALQAIAQELYQDGYDEAEPTGLGCIAYADRITAVVEALEPVNGQDVGPPPSVLPEDRR